MARHIDFEAELSDLDRGIKQGITAERLANGEYAVTSSNGVDTYKVSHDMCSCTGYWRWHRCKHIAIVHQLQLKNKEIVLCEVCGNWLRIAPPMSVDEYERLHDN